MAEVLFSLIERNCVSSRVVQNIANKEEAEKCRDLGKVQFLQQQCFAVL